MIYTISEKKEPISNCILESELPFNSDSNSNNKNDDNGSSFIQNGNDNNNNSNSKQYIALPNLFKKQKLKWFNYNNESIMPEHAHNTDAKFDLKYPGKAAIKLEPYLHICIDLKVALEISTTTMVQLASRNSLAKKEINIRGEIIDARYVGNIIAMLQNDLKKPIL
ncbi:hypothetical protein G9A89_023721 [Geosiphon pyriformis]|nr:hypothetical protein G9A89_023721 [Geosiphon pyriformis]